MKYKYKLRVPCQRQGQGNGTKKKFRAYNGVRHIPRKSPSQSRRCDGDLESEKGGATGTEGN